MALRVPVKWLQDYVDIDLPPEELAERLTVAGLEVEAVEAIGAQWDRDKVLVGEVTAVAPHPNADRLCLVTATAGGGHEVAVVTGAPNMLRYREEPLPPEPLKSPLALVGAELIDGHATDGRTLKLKAGNIRGVRSEGMVCSEKELGLSDDHEGILLLPPDAPTGTPLEDYLGDHVLEFDIKGGFAHLMSVFGVAREAAALTGKPLDGRVLEQWRDEALRITGEPDYVRLEIADPDLCARYTAVRVEGITVQPSPFWLQQRLIRAGQRPINAVVDVTNYVMLELGQPMHAFDLQRLSESIVVRWARNGETMALLDGRTVELDERTLVIADASGPVAMAGIMGGEATAVGSETRDIFLESACFLPAALAGRARHYACHTDSSHRFERGVDPQLQQLAVERATALILRICGGQPGPAHDTVESEALPQRDPITLRSARIERLLGDRPRRGEVEEILLRLGLKVSANENGWTATPPSWRYDLSIEADLIEEIARLRGYNRAPRTHGVLVPRIAPTPESRRPVDAVRDLLVDRDYREVITYSFVDEELQRRLEPETAALALANPIASDMGVMRTSLWPGLIQTLRHNLNRQQERVRIFEIGRTWHPGVETLERDSVGGLVAGPVWEEQWGASERTADFFDVKADLEALLGPRVSARCVFEAASDPALHPGQCARVRIDGASAGWLGTLHPRLQRELELESAPVLFELELAPLLEVGLPAYRPVSRYPSIRRDLALVVDEALPVAELLDSVREAAGEDLQDAFIFDVYRGKGVDSGRKSVALGLILQGLSRTLTDSEVEAATRAILDHLDQRHGATLRE